MCTGYVSHCTSLAVRTQQARETGRARRALHGLARMSGDPTPPTASATAHVTAPSPLEKHTIRSIKASTHHPRKIEAKQAWKVLNVIGSGRLEGLEPSRENVERLVQIASGAITIEEAIAELDARYKLHGESPSARWAMTANLGSLRRRKDVIALLRH